MATDIVCEATDHPFVQRAASRRAVFEFRYIAARFMLAISAGLLHAAAWLFPGAWYAAWLAQAALIGTGAVNRPRSALLYGSLSGGIGIGLSFYWGLSALHNTFDTAPLIAYGVFCLLVAVEAAGFGVFCWGISIATRRGAAALWIAPFLWVAIEHWLPRVFPWKLAYSQLELLPLIQIAEFTGPEGISFVVTATAAAPSLLWLGFASAPAARPAATSNRRHLAFLSAVAGLLLLFTLLFGQLRMQQWTSWAQRQPKLRVALIQVDPADNGSEENFRRRSLAIHEQVDLICWPESSLGTYCEELSDFRDPDVTFALSRQSHHCLEPAKDFSCHLLAGGRSYEKSAGDDGPYAMTAFLIAPDQTIEGRYRKRTLLPLGEYIPGDRWLPALRRWSGLNELSTIGNDVRPLTLSTTKSNVGVVICYEDTLVENSRQTAGRGAQVLCSLIQGTAFENPLTLVQHQRLAVLRAVENRRYFLRCASTGITCMVDPSGRIMAQLAPQREGTLISDVHLVKEKSVFTRIGDVFSALCTGIVFFAFCFWQLSKRRNHQKNTNILL